MLTHVACRPQTLLGLCSVMLSAAVGASAADRAEEAVAAALAIGEALYSFQPERLALTVRLGEREVQLLEGVGPAWEVDGRQHSVTPDRLRFAAVPGQTRPARWECTAEPGAVRWQVGFGRGNEDDVTLRFVSTDTRIGRVCPGQATAGGRWTALDLSQYGLAHGQTHWPKTFYLHDHDLFLCAWWAYDQSHAGADHWPAAAADPRTGRGPFAPAAEMLYPVAPDGRLATLHEVLHVRVSRSLWQAVLPALCRPSEYRQDLATMVYLDAWGGSPAPELSQALRSFRRLLDGHVRLLTIVQNWQAGGFDALLPDSLWLPDYPPSPAVGTVDQLRELAEIGNSLGRMGFRTNYVYLRQTSPSARRGLAHAATDRQGKAAWFTRPEDWLQLAARQESEIARLWRPTASFTDQLTSGGPTSYVDFGSADPAGRTIAGAIRQQRALARQIKAAHQGPLGSETHIQQDLIGAYYDFADFGIMGGHDRLFPPDYKLRRLQEITLSYGCGLPYRFFELPPFARYHAGQLDVWANPELMDDYRCCEVMLGNGGYLFWPAPWDWALTECLVVGRLQRFYALVPVRSVRYWVGGRWQDLEALVRAGFAPEARPWNQKQAELGRVQVEYANGFRVVTNRLPEEHTVTMHGQEIALPRYGWAAGDGDGRFLAYSAYWPGTRHRVDALTDATAGIGFLNPRGTTVDGSDRVRLLDLRRNRLLWSLSADRQSVEISGETVPLGLPRPPPWRDLQCDFREGLGAWLPAAGILRVESLAEGGGTCLVICSADPQLVSPVLELQGQPGDVLELHLMADCKGTGQLYFATPEDGISERQVAHFEVEADRAWHTVTIPVGRHPRWAGARITRLRLDPVHGPENGTIAVRSLALRRGGPAVMRDGAGLW